MNTLVYIPALVGLVTAYHVPSSRQEDIFLVPMHPSNSSAAVAEAFVSYSIEFAWFPWYSGNLSQPNTFTNNLLSNFVEHQGVRPHIRVGGNTQDNAVYDDDLDGAVNGTFGNPDIQYPTTLTYGKSFFEGYQTLTGVKFSHGFNLAYNNETGIASLEAALKLACGALSLDSFEYFEIGNEADQYASNKSNRPAVREEGYSPAGYVADWSGRANLAKDVWADSGCSHLPFRFMGPSHAGLTWTKPTFEEGYADNGTVAMVSAHNYMGSANDDDVTLQLTLMNHTRNVAIVGSHVDRMTELQEYRLPYMIGEGNSLSSQGRSGLSDSFGAALWGVDFSLYAASVGIQRIHFHQGVNYNYASWQPASYMTTEPATKPPYYGNMAVAATLGDVTKQDTRVESIAMPAGDDFESAYAIYKQGMLAKIAIVNLVEFNSTAAAANNTTRGSRSYSFQVDDGEPSSVLRPDKKKPYHYTVQRLVSGGSDVLSGITFDGWSYNYELDEGRPVRLPNVTSSSDDETVDFLPPTAGGLITIDVPDSSYAIININL